MKQRIPNGIYSTELRTQAVKQVLEDGLSVKEVAQRLNLPYSSLSYLIKLSKAGKLGEVGKNQKEKWLRLFEQQSPIYKWKLGVVEQA